MTTLFECRKHYSIPWLALYINWLLCSARLKCLGCFIINRNIVEFIIILISIFLECNIRIFFIQKAILCDIFWKNVFRPYIHLLFEMTPWCPSHREGTYLRVRTRWQYFCLTKQQTSKIVHESKTHRRTWRT